MEHFAELDSPFGPDLLLGQLTASESLSEPFTYSVLALIPWPNKGSSSDLENGSTSVFIGGKPIMLRDVSFFKVSSGDEGATKGLKKGIVSGQVQGKIYSAFWSMDVFVEGCNVCRHDDPTTHNHG